jgi:hypothetical protein
MNKLTYAILLVLAVGLAFGAGQRVGRNRPAPPTTLRERPAKPALPAGVAGNRLTAVLARPASLERAADFAQLLRELGPESLGEAQAAFEALPVDVGELPSALFAAWWAQFEPAAAFAWVRDRRPFSKLTHSMTVRTWARDDPRAAAQAISDIAGTDLRIAILRNLAFGWAESGTPGLDEYLRELANPGEQQMAAEAYARWLVEHEGPQAAIDWAEGIPTDERDMKSHAVSRTGKEVARVDPLLAAAFAEKHAGEEYGWSVYRFVGRTWAARDGRAAMEWLATLPAGKDRDKGVEITYRSWLGNDREGALAWMRTKFQEPWLEPARIYFAAAVSYDSYPEGLAAAATISDQGSRESAMVVFLRRWVAEDESAAREWMTQAGTPQELLDRVFAPEPERPIRPRQSR